MFYVISNDSKQAGIYLLVTHNGLIVGLSDDVISTAEAKKKQTIKYVD